MLLAFKEEPINCPTILFAFGSMMYMKSVDGLRTIQQKNAICLSEGQTGVNHLHRLEVGFQTLPWYPMRSAEMQTGRCMWKKGQCEHVCFALGPCTFPLSIGINRKNPNEFFFIFVWVIWRLTMCFFFCFFF